MKTSKIYILAGLPGAGKSTLSIKINKASGAAIVASDAIRKKLFGSEEVQCDNRIVFNQYHYDIEACLKAGKSVICDATNISVIARSKAIALGKKYNAEIICVYISKDAQTCIKQQKNRSRKVPESVIYKMEEKFEIPSYNEGINKIITI